MIMSTLKRITIALIAALFLFAAPSCATKKNEEAEAYRAAVWLKEHGADPEQVDQLSNRQVIEIYEAAQKGERSVTTEGITINITPIGPMKPIGPIKPDINFDYDQLLSKFDKHAKDFGVTGTSTRANVEKFREAMERHIADPATQEIKGWFKQTQPVTHYVNPNTGLNVFKDAAGNYISGWKLNPTQLNNVLTRGSL